MGVCDSRPCQNNGECLDIGEFFTCNCYGTGFTGDRCETGKRHSYFLTLNKQILDEHSE